MVKEIKVVPVAGTPENGTIFPKSDKLVWKEYQRVINEMVKNMSEGGFRLIIPVWNKFDLEFLRSAERHGVPVDFVVPYKEWGETRLPKFQTDLVKRMKQKKGNRVLIARGKSFTERVHRSILGADMAVFLEHSTEIEQFYSTMRKAVDEGKSARRFPINRMRYTTEEEAETMLNKEAQSVEYEQIEFL